MAPRLGRNVGRATLALFLSTAIACVLVLAGCVGAGDDSLSPLSPTDAGEAGDVRASDAPSDAPARDAQVVDARAVDAMDSTVADAATLLDGGDGGLVAEGGAPIARFAPAVELGPVG